MESKQFGEVILELRKKNNLTQQELANQLNITDKAVSKWERGLSYPDITSISKLASILGVDSSYLIDLCKKNPPTKKKENIKDLIQLICSCVGLGMGVSVSVLSQLNQIQIKDAISMLGIGLSCLGIVVISKR